MDHSPTQEFFGIRISGRVRMALPLTHVESVLRIPPQQICPIPGVPSPFLGVFNQRGVLIWAFDFSQFLQLDSPPQLSGSSYLGVVLRSSSGAETDEGRPGVRHLACLISELEGIYQLSAEQLRPLPSQLRSDWRQLFRGAILRPALGTESPLENGSSPSTALHRVVVLDIPRLFETLNPEKAMIELPPLQLQLMSA